MINRHNLIYISETGRLEALKKVENLSKEIEELVLNNNIPAIVTRQYLCKEGFIQCGFTSPQTYDDNRLRVGVTVSENDILSYYTPFEIISNSVRNSKDEILSELVILGDTTGYEVGIYGSCAMERITGFNYLNEKSDIDIFIRKNKKNCSFNELINGINLIEKKYKVKIDGEIEVLGNFGVKIKEIYSSQKTVLAKGINSVEIYTKESIKKYYDCE